MYTQQDERWTSIPLGTAGGETIGSAGCLLTVGGGMLDHATAAKGASTYRSWYGVMNIGRHGPGTLNRWLCRNNGYTRGNMIVFAKLGEPAGLACEVIDCSRRAAPMDKVQATLDAGGYPLVKVDFRPGGAVQQHWVRILELTDNDALIHDPWLSDGGPYWLLARYAHWTWDDVARAVFRMALYTKEGRDDSMGKMSVGGEAKAFRTMGPVQCTLSPRSRSLHARLVAWGRGARRRMGR